MPAGAGAGAAGSGTGVVPECAAGGGSGALGSWIGAVALLGPEIGITGAVGTRAVAAPAGVTAVVMARGTAGAPGTGIGVVNSLGWVTPAPGRARSVMRTVSFFSGTAEVLADGTGGGVGGVLFSSLMVKKIDPREARGIPAI